MTKKSAQLQSSADAREIENFNELAVQWWNSVGPMKHLHQMNPARLSFIRQSICKQFGKDYQDADALKNIEILDIGCGGGLLCEPLARQGANVTGIDAAPQAIDVAQNHAKEVGLNIKYLNLTAEDLLGKKQKYDVITALEIIEHVANPADFVQTLCRLLKPDGVIILSTLNRTAKSYLMAIVGAEYIARILPVGTHQWQKFIKPSELYRLFETQGFQMDMIKGLRYHPLQKTFSLSADDMAVNYICSFRKRRK